MPSDPLSEAYAALTRFLVTDVSVHDTLQRIAEITIEAIPAAHVAGITLLQDDGRPTTAIFTDETSPLVDAAQYESGRGPCLDAWRERRVVRVDDTAEAGQPYPEFRALAHEYGILSTLSLPLSAGDSGMGALNLYAGRRLAFSAEGEARGTDLAAAASTVLANVSAYWTAFELNKNLNEAMQHRSTIEQAKGMLMAWSPGMSADQAFDVLRKASQRENVKLRDIATRIVQRRSLADGGD